MGWGWAEEGEEDSNNVKVNVEMMKTQKRWRSERVMRDMTEKKGSQKTKMDRKETDHSRRT